MRTARNIALAAVVAGAMPGCTEPEIMARAPCWAELRASRGTEMPDLEMQAGDTVRSGLKDYFHPDACLEGYEERGDHIFLAESSDPSAVAVSTWYNDLEIVAIGATDSVRVTVGIDPAWTGVVSREYFVSHEFLVSVGEG